MRRLTGKLIGLLNDAVRDHISELAESADPDSDLDDHFDPISDFLRDIEELTIYNDGLQPRIRELDALTDGSQGVS